MLKLHLLVSEITNLWKIVYIFFLINCYLYISILYWKNKSNIGEIELLPDDSSFEQFNMVLMKFIYHNMYYILIGISMPQISKKESWSWIKLIKKWFVRSLSYPKVTHIPLFQINTFHKIQTTLYYLYNLYFIFHSNV